MAKRNERPKRNLAYRVGTFREAGLEAKWGRTRQGAPIILVRDPNADHAHQRVNWWVCDRGMFEAMREDAHSLGDDARGILQAFDGWTLLGNMFSVPA